MNIKNIVFLILILVYACSDNNINTSESVINDNTEIQNKKVSVKLKTGKVTSDLLNLRRGPSIEFDISSQLKGNTQVIILDEKLNKKNELWFLIKVPETDMEGWVYSIYIKTQ